jgi:hypothetical protein
MDAKSRLESSIQSVEIELLTLAQQIDAVEAQIRQTTSASSEATEDPVLFGRLLDHEKQLREEKILLLDEKKQLRDEKMRLTEALRGLKRQSALWNWQVQYFLSLQI